MNFSPDLIAELNLLTQFEVGKQPTTGIKVRSTAAPESIAAAARLHEKGLTSQVDGGYLTPGGVEAAMHAQALLRVLTFRKS